MHGFVTGKVMLYGLKYRIDIGCSKKMKLFLAEVVELHTLLFKNFHER